MEDKGTPAKLTQEELEKVTGGRHISQEEQKSLDTYRKKVYQWVSEGKLDPGEGDGFLRVLDVYFKDPPDSWTLEEWIEDNGYGYLLD